MCVFYTKAVSGRSSFQSDLQAPTKYVINMLFIEKKEGREGGMKGKSKGEKEE